MTRLRDNQALRDEVHGLLAAHDGTGVIVAGFAARKALRRDTMTRILDAVDRALTATGPGSGMSYSEARSLGHCGALMDDDGTRCTNAAPRGGSDCIKHRHVTGAATGPGSGRPDAAAFAATIFDPRWDYFDSVVAAIRIRDAQCRDTAASQTDHRAAPDPAVPVAVPTPAATKRPLCMAPTDDSESADGREAGYCDVYEGAEGPRCTRVCAVGGHEGQGEPVVADECVRCLSCKLCAGACDCTGGPVIEPECTCYELTGGHQPGCAFNRTPATPPSGNPPAVTEPTPRGTALWNEVIAVVFDVSTQRLPTNLATAALVRIFDRHMEGAEGGRCTNCGQAMLVAPFCSRYCQDSWCAKPKKSASAAAPGEPVTSGSPPGAAPKCVNCDDDGFVVFAGVTSRCACQDGSRGTR